MDIKLLDNLIKNQECFPILHQNDQYLIFGRDKDLPDDIGVKLKHSELGMIFKLNKTVNHSYFKDPINTILKIVKKNPYISPELFVYDSIFLIQNDNLLKQQLAESLGLFFKKLIQDNKISKNDISFDGKNTIKIDDFDSDYIDILKLLLDKKIKGYKVRHIIIGNGDDIIVFIKGNKISNLYVYQNHEDSTISIVEHKPKYKSTKDIISQLEPFIDNDSNIKSLWKNGLTFGLDMYRESKDSNIFMKTGMFVIGTAMGLAGAVAFTPIALGIDLFQYLNEDISLQEFLNAIIVDENSLTEDQINLLNTLNNGLKSNKCINLTEDEIQQYVEFKRKLEIFESKLK